MKYKFDKQLKNHPNLPFCKALLPVANAALRVMPKGIDGSKVVYRKYKCGSVGLHSITPKTADAKGGLPCLFYIHGGGFGYAESFVHYHAEQLYAVGANCMVVGVDYDLLPSAKYPVAANQCVQAYRYVTQNPDTFGIFCDKIVVGGDSAGGSLALEVCRLLTSADVLPVGLLAVYPVVDDRTDDTSMLTYTDTPLWNAKNNAKMWQMYLGGAEYRSPLADADKYSYLQHAFVEAEQFDCLHDQDAELANVLQSVVADVTLVQNDGTFHGFEINKNADVTRQSFARRIEFLKRCFE